ncbi:MAG: GSCFA domain-containing protein [Lentisphaeraceae bacterium]|nr:GSCFA domain-containing protein [Lentisphaeraceae bacterium]
MKFRTEIELKKELLLEPENSILALGSCFADRIGERFSNKGLNVLSNPFGVIYNPVSMYKTLLCSVKGEGVLGDWEENNGQFANLMYHGNFNADSEEDGFKKAITAHQQVKESVSKSTMMVLTWGTAYAYEDVESGEVVCNCHRFPSSRFRRRLLGVDEIVFVWAELLNKCFALNPNLKVVLTVSPVRHVRDSLVKNNLSKSVLHVALHKLMDKFDKLHYFPSFEIMMDDLRDYRFYDENLVQPNEQAVTYIVSKFSQFCFTQSLVDYWNEAEELEKLLSHKIKGTGEESQKFEQKREQKLSIFLKKYPFSKIAES